VTAAGCPTASGCGIVQTQKGRWHGWRKSTPGRQPSRISPAGSRQSSRTLAAKVNLEFVITPVADKPGTGVVF
jgi:hypothetical protein